MNSHLQTFQTEQKRSYEQFEAERSRHRIASNIESGNKEASVEWEEGEVKAMQLGRTPSVL